MKFKVLFIWEFQTRFPVQEVNTIRLSYTTRLPFIPQIDYQYTLHKSQIGIKEISSITWLSSHSMFVIMVKPFDELTRVQSQLRKVKISLYEEIHKRLERGWTLHDETSKRLYQKLKANEETKRTPEEAELPRPPAKYLDPWEIDEEVE